MKLLTNFHSISLISILLSKKLLTLIYFMFSPFVINNFYFMWIYALKGKENIFCLNFNKSYYIRHISAILNICDLCMLVYLLGSQMSLYTWNVNYAELYPQRWKWIPVFHREAWESLLLMTWWPLLSAEPDVIQIPRIFISHGLSPDLYVYLCILVNRTHS